MTARRPHVSDHAMLRYLERVVGIDVESHRRVVEARVGLGVDLGAAAVVSEGFRYILQDVRVTTVVPVRSDPRLQRHDRPEDGGRNDR